MNLLLSKAKNNINAHEKGNVFHENKSGDEVEEIILNLKRIFRML